MSSPRYEAYARFARRIAGIRNYMRRNWLPLSALGVAILIGTGTLMGIKGNISEDASGIDGLTFVYGEGFGMQASALMGEARIEYAPADSDAWSEAVPNEVGQYKCRAKADGTFGEKTGEVHYFTISPREAEVTLVFNHVIYGEDVTFTCSNLLAGHRLSDVDYSFASFASTETTIHVESAVIVDADGVDVSKNYDIALPSDDTVVTFAERAIRLSTAAESYVYDGEEHSYSGEVSVGGSGLAYEDRVVLERNGITHVGKVGAGRFSILSREGESRDHLYSVTDASNDVTVTQRPITFSSQDVAKVYDGKPFTLEERGTVRRLCEVATPDASETEFLDADIFEPGVMDNDFTYSIENPDDYKITKQIGKLTVEKRPLHLEISGAWLYEGAPWIPDEGVERLVDPTYIHLRDDTTLAPGEELRVYGLIDPFLNVYDDDVAVDPDWVDYGRHYDDFTVAASNMVYRVEILRGDQDVADTCYDVTLAGEMVYSYASFSIAGKDQVFVYDGKPHELQIEINGMQGQDRPSYDLIAASDAITRPGTLTSQIRFYGVIDDQGHDHTRFYNYSVHAPRVEITTRPLQIVVNKDFAYDGVHSPYQDLIEGVDYFIENGTSLAEGDTLRVYPVDGRLFDDDNDDPLTDFTIVNTDGEDVRDCYEVTYDDTNVTETRHPITIQGREESFVYDGYAHTLGYDVLNGFPEDVYNVVWDTATTSITKVGAISGTPTFDSAYNPSLGFTTSYYAASSTSARVEITKRPLQIEVNLNRFYDGTNINRQLSQYYGEFSYAVGENIGLASTDYLTVTCDSDIYNVPTDPGYLTFAAKVESPSLGDVTDCYDITLNVAAASGTKQDLTISMSDDIREYDGGYQRLTPEVTGLQGGDYIVYAENPASVIVPGIYAYTYTIADIRSTLDNGATSRLDYYNINTMTVSANLTIAKFLLEVWHFSQMTAAPSGYVPYSLGRSVPSQDTVTCSAANAGGGTYDYTFDIYSGQLQRIVTSECYEVITNYVSGDWNRKVIGIQLGSANKPYDGTPIKGFVESVSAPLSEGELTIVYASNDAPSTHTQTDVGVLDYTVAPSSIRVMDRWNNDVTAAYDVQVYAGTLEILPRDIHIDIVANRTYDGRLMSYDLTKNEYLIRDDWDTNWRNAPLPSGSDTMKMFPKENTILTGVPVEWTTPIFYRGNTDVTANYNVVSVTDHSVFNKASLTVSGTVGEEVDYDGNPHTPTVTATGLKGSDQLGEVTLDPAGASQTELGTLNYDVLGATVVNGGSDRSKYYDMAYQGGDLTVDITLISLELGDYYGVYDGTTYDYAEYISKSRINVPGLLPGHHIDLESLVIQGSVSAEGQTKFTNDNVDWSTFRVLDADGNDVSSQYDVDKVSGSVTLEPFYFYVNMPSLSKIYDGEDMTAVATASSSGMALASGRTPDWGDLGSYEILCTTTNFPSYSDAGEYDVAVSVSMIVVRVVGSSGDLDSGCYEVRLNVSSVHLSIHRRAVTFATDPLVDEVGYAVDPGELRLCAGTLAEGDYFEAIPPEWRTYYFPIDEDDGYYNDGWSVVIRDRNGDDVTYNYNINFIYGKVVILGDE